MTNPIYTAKKNTTIPMEYPLALLKLFLKRKMQFVWHKGDSCEIVYFPFFYPFLVSVDKCLFLLKMCLIVI